MDVLYLFHRYRDDVYRLAVNYTHNPQEAEDVCQTVLLKALAVCYITQLASDCCRDSGESAVAGKIEFAGKIAVLLIAVPLFESILGIVKDLIM